MKKEELVEVAYCDCCGEKIVENAGDHHPFFVVHNVDGEVAYESAIIGDYCSRCLRGLVYGWLSVIRKIPERYDTRDEKALKEELELVKEGLKEVEEDESDFNKYFSRC